MMNRRTLLQLIPALAFGLTPLAHAGITADQIIKKADEVRNPGESYEMQVRVESSDSTTPSVFEVKLQGNTKTLVKTLQPARDRGRNLLMLEEDMWAYIPNIKRAVRVSMAQKLSGQAANGDISRMRWSGDYDAKIEKETEAEWQILLKAKKKGLTYAQIRVWITKENFHPQRADYLSVSGKPLKKTQFKSYQKIAGKIRPTEILIQDAVRTEDRSIIRIEKMAIRNFPSSFFRQTNLR